MAAIPVEKPERYQQPAGWLYTLLTLLAGFLLYVFFGLRVRRDPAVRHLRGPLIVLGNHPSYIDPLIMAVALYPRRIHFLTTRNFFRIGLARAILLRVAAIPKVQFRTDTRALKRMLLTIRSGGILGIYPEGQRSLTGDLLPVDEAIAKLIRKAACPVVTVVEQGAYLTWPRWSQSGLRPGRIDAGVRLLFSADELKQLDLAETQARIISQLNYREYDQQRRRPRVHFSLAPARGLHQICHQCPACGRDLAMVSSRFHLTCRVCGNRGRIDRFGLLRPAGPGPGQIPADPALWHRWQLDTMRQRLSGGDYRFVFRCSLELLDDDGRVSPAGSGQLELTAAGLVYLGKKPVQTGGIGELALPYMNRTGISADYGRQFEMTVNDQAYRFVFEQGQAVILLADAIQILQEGARQDPV